MTIVAGGFASFKRVTWRRSGIHDWLRRRSSTSAEIRSLEENLEAYRVIRSFLRAHGIVGGSGG